MTIALSTATRNARIQAIITAAGAAAKMKFYDGTRPASGAVAGGNLLATLTSGSVIGTASGGVLDFDEASFTQTNTNHVNGTPTWVRITTSADVWVADLSIPADMTFTGAITNGLDVTLGACSIAEGNA